MTARDLWLRVRALLLHRRVERELHEELDFHVEMQTRKHLAAGLDLADARRLACLQFGSTALVEDRVRDARGIGLVETLVQDLRYAVRSFRRAPGFAVTVVGTIALGLGLNAGVFTIFNAYVLTPFAVRDPYSLYEFTWDTRGGRFHRFTWPEFDQLRRDNAVFSEIHAERHQLVTRIDGHTAYTLLVTGNYFRMLGVNAALGRTLEPSDTEAPGREAVAVLSYAFWQRQFGGDPAVVGRTILIQGHRCEVVGVARPGFDGLSQTPPHDIWVPVTIDPLLEDGPSLFASNPPNRLGVVGRLKPGVSLQAARAALLVWAQHATEKLADQDKAATVRLESRATSVPLSPMVMLALSPIAVAFALVLLIACANVANMMLARGLARQREIGIRLTLGAGRRRLVRQLLTESVLLALPAGAAGFVVSRLAVTGAVSAMLATMPSEFVEFIRVAPLPPDWRVLAFMLVAALGTGIVFGLAPALQTTRANVVQMARGDFGSDFGPWRLRRALVVAQITASVLLLITAAVLLRSAQRFANVDPGLRTRDVISLDIREPFRAKVLEALAASPVVVGIASASTIPLDASSPGVSVALPARSDVFRTRYRFVSPGYFDVFDVAIRSGRNFTLEEARAGAAVAIVSETAAQQWWPDRDAIGQSLRIVLDGPVRDATARLGRHATVQVIGVAVDTAADLGQTGPFHSAIHLPIDPTASGTGLVVRVNGEAEAARRSLDRSLAVAAPGAVQEIHKLQEFVAGRLYPFRAAYWVSGAIGALALLLTVSGVYGVLSYLVAQGAKEIGIRIALGANVSAVVSLVLGQSLRLAAIGLPIGVLLALGAARVFGWRVMMLRAFDPFAYVAGTLVVVIACVVASSFPALRAARLDPMTTLRAD
jgi:predicted permease